MITRFNQHLPHDFTKIKIGLKALEDANLLIGNYKKANPRLGDKAFIAQAISTNNIAVLREASDFYYRSSGIYNRLCRYLAYMYRYDWLLTPILQDVTKRNLNEQVVTIFKHISMVLDKFNPKKFFGEVALKVVKNGAYCGYLMQDENSIRIQELPIDYIRSRFTDSEGRPVVEFNMKYFDQAFTDADQRARMLKIFPSEFAKGYRLYKANKLKPDFPGDSNGWYLLEGDAVYFSLNDAHFPPLINVIPALIDLDEAQSLDRKKMEQQLLKIIVQRLPLDKNNELVFDIEEAQALHNNAVSMLGKAVGVDVLTTFADVNVEDMTHTTAASAQDKGMDRAKANVYDQSGSAQNLFNSTGNLALEKSILNDEAMMYGLVQQFESFLSYALKIYNNKYKEFRFKISILPTTIYNYKDMAKLYKEQATLGYSKFLPPLALGMSQSEIIAAAFFENDILHLDECLRPLQSSNTMSAASSDQGGRPTNEEKGESVSDKTLANKEAAQ